VLELVSLSLHLTRDESRNEVERRYYLYPVALILNPPGTFATAIWDGDLGAPHLERLHLHDKSSIYCIY
jgi:hypothetical protein